MKREWKMQVIIKQIVSIVLVLCLSMTLMPYTSMNVEAATGLTLAQLRQKYPHGKYWNHAGNPGNSSSVNNQDGYTSTPCSVHGVVGTSRQTCNGFQPAGAGIQLSWQCMGYAEKLGYDATGCNPRNNANGWYTYTSSSALDTLKPGDIVRYNNDGHSIYVIGVNGDTVTYTDCNSDGHCLIRWDATISKSTLKSSFTYVRSAPTAVTPGSISCSCSASYAGTYVCTTTSADLIIRSGHGASYSAIGSIPPGATVTVSKASGTSSNDWAHVTYNGVTGYASMQYLALKQATQERETKVRMWFSDSQMGDGIASIRTGEYLYFCYKLFDGNTGDLFDTYNADGEYTVKLILYETNGTVAHTVTYSNDNNWIAIKRNTPGEYKAELVFTSNTVDSATFSVAINMVYEPKVIPSASDVQLNMTNTSSQSISVSYSGATKSDGVYLECTTSSDCFTYKMGNWNDHKMSVTITGTRAGQGVLTIELHDADTDEIIATSKVFVTVTAPEYTVSYNANGGSGAPGNQIKCYNEDLTLSNVKPSREGYTFMGWSASKTATSATYQPGEKFNDNLNVTLYAVWKKGCENGAHSYSYKVTNAPTISATGMLTGTCSKCSGTTKVVLPKLNTTDYSYATKNAATCTKTGSAQYTWKTSKYGNFCFDVSIPATGHNYAKGICTICGVVDPNYVTDKDAPTIVVDNVSGKAGEAVIVKVNMKNNPGFGGMAYSILYDETILELVSYEIGLGNSICTDSGVGTYSNKINLQYAGTSNITGDGVLVTLKFKIKSSVSEGTTVVSLVPEDGTFFSYDGRIEKDFKVTCINGSVKVVKYIKGDINGDGKVNNRDAARLLQYLAGWDVDCVGAPIDVNGDGKVNNRDAARLLQYLAGWDVELH